MFMVFGYMHQGIYHANMSTVNYINYELELQSSHMPSDKGSVHKRKEHTMLTYLCPISIIAGGRSPYNVCITAITSLVRVCSYK